MSKKEGEAKMTKAAEIRALRIQVTFLQKQMLKAADAIDVLNAENKALRERGDKLIHELDTNDGTIDAQWRIGNAVAAWQEFDLGTN